MKKSLFTALILLLCIPVMAQEKPKNKDQKKYQQQLPTQKELAETKAANIKKAAATQFQYFIIKADSARYGYSIYADGHLYIRQNTIPAIGGNKGFADTASAGKTARLVIQKIKQGEMPPAITADDLKKLKAIE